MGYTQRKVVIFYRLCETICPIFKVQEMKEEGYMSWFLKMVPVGCSEILVINYHSKLRINTEKRISR